MASQVTLIYWQRQPKDAPNTASAIATKQIPQRGCRDAAHDLDVRTGGHGVTIKYPSGRLVEVRCNG